ncbi:hypothetical protein GCM10027168_15320 [Streptomyces capparidis]
MVGYAFGFLLVVFVGLLALAVWSTSVRRESRSGYRPGRSGRGTPDHGGTWWGGGNSASSCDSGGSSGGFSFGSSGGDSCGGGGGGGGD